jgi:hypothetical protein
MRRDTCEMWCDECGKSIEPGSATQWIANRFNGYRTREFCSYPCADKYADAAVSLYTAQGGDA